MKLFISFLGMWGALTIASYLLMHATKAERISVAKAVGFGFVTALLTATITIAVVFLF
jgi:hypothetical protein